MINLEKAEKGAKINLSKISDAAGVGLKKLKLGLGWDPIKGAGEFDADLSVAFLNSAGIVTEGERFLFYGSPKNSEGLLVAGDYAVHTGDNLDGEGEGDDEAVVLDLPKIPSDVTKIEVYVTIHKANERKQNFGMVTNASIRAENMETNEDMTKFELDFDASTASAIKFSTLHLRNGEWIFAADNVEVEGGLEKIVSNLGFSS